MLPVLWRSKARLSLAQINNYIADRNPTAAQRLKDAIEQAASNLPQHPYLYRPGRLNPRNCRASELCGGVPGYILNH